MIYINLYEKGFFVYLIGSRKTCNFYFTFSVISYFYMNQNDFFSYLDFLTDFCFYFYVYFYLNRKIFFQKANDLKPKTIFSFDFYSYYAIYAYLYLNFYFLIDLNHYLSNHLAYFSFFLQLVVFLFSRLSNLIAPLFPVFRRFLFFVFLFPIFDPVLLNLEFVSFGGRKS